MISSSAANGSSISRISGSVTSARASETRIFMPPDNSRGIGVGKFGEPDLRQRFADARVRFGRGACASFSGSRTFSRTLVHGISVGSWNTKPMRCRAHRALPA